MSRTGATAIGVIWPVLPQEGRRRRQLARPNRRQSGPIWECRSARTTKSEFRTVKPNLTAVWSSRRYLSVAFGGSARRPQQQENVDEDHVPCSGGRPGLGDRHCLADPGGACLARLSVSA